ncbi:hypothetical protein ENH_00012560 [Eimeria necatrix]|uniref:Retrotransposon gag domain-containing protein n=1 Tax=Eimeria necatrix TaxID=51315 RepID=U6ME61_9EIME|nr:hypothetical protein ENH_00012560 [Eimeria necatrix]CDJ62306.1 hypothetical protein ENH_00012560 [Eimeria necatrix]
MSVNKTPSGTPDHHRHATPKPTVAERPHGHKEATPQVIPMTNVMPGDRPCVKWDQFQSAVSVIRTVIEGTVESGATTPILPEDGSTMQAFLLRIERRYTQMGLEPREWGNALIDHLVGPALTYWMYLWRTIDLSDWATVQRRLLKRFDKTMSQIQLLTELAKVRWNGNTKEYTDRFEAVAERGLGLAPDELADYYSTGLPTDLHLLITNNGQVKYQSWEQAATASSRLYEPKQSVLELRERTSRAIRAAESGSPSILSEETPDATTDSSRKSAEATEDGYRSDATEIVPHWWRETCTKESYDQGGALCCAGETAVLRVELAGSPYKALLDTGASRSFISPKIVERLQLQMRRLPKEHRFTIATGAQVRIDRVVTGLTLWCGHTRFSGDFLVGPVPYDLVLGLDWLTEHKVAWYFQSDKLRTYVNGQWCELPVVRTGEATLQRDRPTVVHPRTPAEQAYEILAKKVAGMSAEEAAIFLRPPPRRYKSHAKTKAKARITSLVHQPAADTNDLRTPLHGLHLILALPKAGSVVPLRLSDEWQGALCCALIGNQPTSSGWRSPLASTASVVAESD